MNLFNKSILKYFLCFWAVIGISQFGIAGKKYAGPNGSDQASGTSPSTPLSLQKAFSASSPLVPGDTLILLDGIYEGNFTLEKSGTASKPIYFLPQNEGKAIIDPGKNRTTGTGIILNASNVWLIGIHITSSSVSKRSDLGESVPYESGITVFGSYVKLINCWVYDIPGGGLELWRTALNLEVYGCVIFNNGSQSTDRGTGHGMYIQHDEPGFPKIIRNNFVFNNASQGINIFTTNPPNGGVFVIENTAFNTGSIANFDESLFRPPHNFTVGSSNNLSFFIRAYDNVFFTDLQKGRLTKDLVSNVSLGRNYQPNQDFQFYRNTLYGGGNQVELQPLETFKFSENNFFNVHGKFFQFLTVPQSMPATTWDNNSYFLLNPDELGFTGLNFQNWKSTSGFDASSSLQTSPPTSLQSWIRKNTYDSNKFYVTILNFNGQSSVELDFSTYSILEGSEYQIIDVQNPFDGDSKIEGVYNGSKISFPLNWTKALAPKGNMPHSPVHSESVFGTFQIKFSKPLAPPAFKDTVKIYLDELGKGVINAESVLKEQAPPVFSYSFSKGPELNCELLGISELIVTTTNTQNNQIYKDTISLYVLDTIAPTFDAADAYVVFDPTIGKATYGIPDFDVIDLKDNCSTNFTWKVDAPEINCALLGANSNTYQKFPVKITVSDQSGNSRTRNLFVHVSNYREAKKVSITSSKPLNEVGASLVLGDELNYEVLGWYKGGTLIPNQKSKELPVSSGGRYHARLLLSTGCEVNSREIYFEEGLPNRNETVEINLDETGKALLKLTDILPSPPLDPAGWTISQTEFSCADFGDRRVKVTYKQELDPDRLSLSSIVEFWAKVKVTDKISPTAEVKRASYQFDLSQGELNLNPNDFLAGLPRDNCDQSSISISLSKGKLTCADQVMGQTDFIVNLELTLKDLAGNTTIYPVAADVELIESKKVSLTSSGILVQGGTVNLILGEELDYQVTQWTRNFEVIPEAKSKTYVANQPGKYQALLKLSSGCTVWSKVLEISYSEFPFPPVKELVELNLGEEGKAELALSQLFAEWPFNSTGLTFELSQQLFTCSDLGEKRIKLFIRNAEGQTWEREIVVLVRDKIKPVLVPKNFELELDVTVGKAEITPNQILEISKDNCTIKSLTISKSSFSCEDIGKEIQVAIRAEDQSGNVTEAVAKVKVKRKESQIVQISGKKEICQGEKTLIELSSSASIEVVRWRRNGVEISGQTGKTLETGEPGVYHAVIRYQGGCLSESQDFELKVNPKPSGEIKVDGNKLIAPEGAFTYQWFRNGEKLEGKTARILEVDKMGEYSVELTSTGGCKAMLPNVTMTIAGLGSRWVKNPETLKIYPNPASNSTRIQLAIDKFGNDEFELNLFNAEGKEVSSQISWLRIEAEVLELYLNDLAKGTYLVWIFGPNQTSFTGKLVIQ